MLDLNDLSPQDMSLLAFISACGNLGWLHNKLIEALLSDHYTSLVTAPNDNLLKCRLLELIDGIEAEIKQRRTRKKWNPL